jgi:hypothetical protein
MTEGQVVGAPREPECSQAAAPVERKRSRRVYVYWGIALFLLISTALFCWAVVVPVWQTRDIIRHYYDETRSSSPLKLNDFPIYATVERLGGAEDAFARLWMYVRLPECLAPHAHCVPELLAGCGLDRAAPKLVELLQDKRPGVRWKALLVIEYAWPYLDSDMRAVALARLESLRDEASGEIRQAAAEALKKIKAGKEKSK